MQKASGEQDCRSDPGFQPARHKTIRSQAWSSPELTDVRSKSFADVKRCHNLIPGLLNGRKYSRPVVALTKYLSLPGNGIAEHCALQKSINPFEATTE